MGYAYQVFMPSGRLNLAAGGDPCTIKLVEGLYRDSALTYLHRNPNTLLPADYATLIFSAATGTPKITRP